MSSGGVNVGPASSPASAPPSSRAASAPASTGAPASTEAVGVTGRPLVLPGVSGLPLGIPGSAGGRSIERSCMYSASEPPTARTATSTIHFVDIRCSSADTVVVLGEGVGRLAGSSRAGLGAAFGAASLDDASTAATAGPALEDDAFTPPFDGAA